MTPSGIDFYSVIEMLSKHYPREDVNMEAKRSPEGVYRYCSTLSPNNKLGFEFVCGWGDSPQQAAKDLIANAGDRDPAAAIAEKIREHEADIAKLRMTLANLALPAWKPISQLGVGNPPPEPQDERPAFMNIESEVV